MFLHHTLKHPHCVYNIGYNARQMEKQAGFPEVGIISAGMRARGDGYLVTDAL